MAEHLGRAAVTRRRLPGWLDAAARALPEVRGRAAQPLPAARRAAPALGACSCLFGDGPGRPGPAAHRAGRHAALARRAAGLPGRRASTRRTTARSAAALREAHGGGRARPGAASRCSARCPTCGCRRPASSSPRSSAWWRAPHAVGVVDAAEVAAVARVPLSRLTDPAHRLLVTHPSGWVGPAFDTGELLVWGFTAGVLDRLLALRRLGAALGPHPHAASSPRGGRAGPRQLARARAAARGRRRSRTADPTCPTRPLTREPDPRRPHPLTPGAPRDPPSSPPCSCVPALALAACGGSAATSPAPPAPSPPQGEPARADGHRRRRRRAASSRRRRSGRRSARWR